MKKNNLITTIIFVGAASFLPHTILAQSDKEKQKLLSDTKAAKSEFIKTDTSMKKLFQNAYAYTIFPKVGKGGFIVGGAGGDGIVYQKGKQIGWAKLGQVSVGAQIGGESYREVIFFENDSALARFKESKMEFGGQVSAVAVKTGVSKDAKYTDGVAVFTQSIGGLMADASVGGQKFKYKAL